MTHNNPADWALFDDVSVDITLSGAYPIRTFTPPVNRDAELVHFHCIFSPCATVADRYLLLSLNIFSTYQFIALTTVPMPATNSWRVFFAQGLEQASIGSLFYQCGPIATRLRIPPNATIFIHVLNYQVGDLVQDVAARWNLQIKTNM